MERVDITDSLALSRIVYGMWRLADDEDTSTKTVMAKVDACLEQGITTFDQADIYGDYGSEAVFGKALKETPSLRDKIEIISKCGIKLISDKWPETRVKHYDTSKEHIVKSVDNSLRHMNVDHLDMLLIHRPDPFMDFEETGAALDANVESGKVRTVGVSNFKQSDWVTLQNTMKSKLYVNQIEINLIESGCFRNGDLAEITAHNMTPMAWSPLAGGALFSRENATLFDRLSEIAREFEVDASAVAIAWLLCHPAKILPVLGTNNLGRIAKLDDALKVSMDRQTWFELYELANGNEVP